MNLRYSVRPGESLYSIARRFGITLFSLIISNPRITNPSQIQAGTVINVPISTGTIISTNVPYTYDILIENINRLRNTYPFLRVESIGKSVLGNDIFVISFGRGANQVTYNASHHANEWITTPVLMKFIEEFAKHIVSGTPLYGFNAAYIYNSATIRIIPMVNPDGVNLSIKGLTEENGAFHEDLIVWNNGSTNFARWSANIRGVDLNHNYNAAWELAKELEAQAGVTGPGPTGYAGPYPESEPETRAMVNFTNSRNFRLVIAYHSQGQVIYWDFMNKEPAESLPIARRFAAISGYTIASPVGTAIGGGYKDWFIDKFRKPGYTIEVGRGVNPLPLSQFNEIYLRNVGILLLAPLV